MPTKFKPMPEYLTEEQLVNFWNKIIKGNEDECWEWDACKTVDGYGHFRVNNGLYFVNRLVYYIHHNEDPGEFEVAHTCNNPACCNPDHLELKTHIDNMQYAVESGSFEERRGENANHVKLTLEQVLEIRRIRKTTCLTYKQIAEDFKITKEQVSNICRGKQWSHV